MYICVNAYIYTYIYIFYKYRILIYVCLQSLYGESGAEENHLMWFPFKNTEMPYFVSYSVVYKSRVADELSNCFNVCECVCIFKGSCRSGKWVGCSANVWAGLGYVLVLGGNTIREVIQYKIRMNARMKCATLLLAVMKFMSKRVFNVSADALWKHAYMVSSVWSFFFVLSNQGFAA